MIWRNALLGAAALMLAACGDNEQQKAQSLADEQPATGQVEIWRFALEEGEGSLQYQYASRFAEVLSQKTYGEVEVRLFPYGRLGSLDEIQGQLQDGSLQLAFASDVLAGVVPESQLFSLGFALSGDELRDTQVLNDARFRQHRDLVDAYRDHDLQPVALVPEGWLVWTANRPIHAPADLAGLSLRIADNPVLRETYSAYGANPVVMSDDDALQAQDSGRLDGSVQPLSRLPQESRQQYLILPRQGQLIASVVANGDWYDNLSDAHEQAIEETVAELVPYIHERQMASAAQSLEELERSGDTQVIRLSPEQQSAFRDAGLPVREWFVDQAGPRGARLLTLLQQYMEEGASAEAQQPVTPTDTTHSLETRTSPVTGEPDQRKNASDDAAESVTP